MTLEGVWVEVEASIGIAASPDHASDASGLLRRADIAMYAAKRGNNAIEVYDGSMDSHSPHRLAIASDLRGAIDSNQLVLHFQPQTSPAGEVKAVEALVRWQHPRLGLIGPDEFVPIAEQTAQIRDLTHWVLRAALAAARDWRRGGTPVGVAVNLSVRNLLDLELPGLVSGLLEESGVPAPDLTLEITETHLMADPPRTMRVVTDLAAIGVRLSIDDFGTGYSSLAYLKALPVNEVKIDKSFVLRIAVDESDQAIVRAIVSLAHSLGLTVVAEGVGDAGTMDVLGGLGCDVVQGYHLGRPMPAGQLTAWLGARGKPDSPIVTPRRPSDSRVQGAQR